MYSVQNQFLQQLSQLTCGVVATVTNTRVRSSTPRTAQKINQLSRSESIKPSPQVTTAASSVLHQENVRTTSKDGSSVVCAPNTTSIEETASVVSNAKNLLGPLLASQLLKLGEAVPLSEQSRFQQDVSELAEKIIDKAAASVKLEAISNQSVDMSLLGQLWGEVLHALNVSPNQSHKLLQMQRKSWIRNIQISEHERLNESAGLSSYLSSRLVSFRSNGSFEVDKRFSVSPFLQPQSQLFTSVPYRSFKTERDVNAAKERNPSMFSRIKDKFFLSKEPAAAASSTTTPTSSDKLKAIIADLPPHEADKMKIAFAEGYMSGNTGGSGSGEKGRTYRWLRTLQQVLAIAVFTAILASLMGSFGGGMFRVSVGNGNEVQPEDINVTFNDVKGVDEAKNELQEIVEFLRNPGKFVALGGKLPKGVLLVGPPGTGKTLLARAVAGEAGVPFFHAAGPEFDEILVGQGARRVRDLFKAAKLKAPCVIFIDEIDSVGAKRTNSVLHPYANQTINQLLSEMDGFRQNEGVIVLGATNRREDLDKALLRPGRFDVEVPVPAPEYKGRKEILDYYLSKVKSSDDVDVDILARGTTGFTGADLENMVNQAALKAAIDGADSVGRKHLDFARDKVIMGPQRKSRIPDEECNKITAYHEAGHALAAYYTKDSNPIHKVTIIPRGASLGHTAYIPDKEQYHITKSQLMALMDTMMGGRAAEELIFGTEKITSGASSDLKQATSIATHMVKEWGMSDKVGLRTIEDNSRSMLAVNDLGPQTSELIDSEIKRLLQESYERAKSILKTHSKEHKALAEALIMYETLDADDVAAILAGQPPPATNRKKFISPPPKAAKPTPGAVGGQKRLNPC